jgi:UDP-N-acetylmuramoyl-L-alanyl-D-glutamate--2,6-diaminopimelate ligase
MADERKKDRLKHDKHQKQSHKKKLKDKEIAKIHGGTVMVKLKNLLKDVSYEALKGSKDIEISGISSNSKCVLPGSLFISKIGSSGEGYNFIAEALSAGCRAIVTDMFNPFLSNITQVIVKDIQTVEAKIAANFYSNPSKNLFIVGITGTSGKTTTSFLIKHLLDHLNISSGLLGTVEYLTGKTKYKASLTTPEAITSQKLFSEMVHTGCKACVMEVSSHSLDQGRVNEIDFDVGIFTNLSSEHLDYHETIDKYAQAKHKLFKDYLNAPMKKTNPKIKAAIVNKDNPWYEKMIEGCNQKIVTYGFSKSSDVLASDLTLSSKGSSFLVSYQGKTSLFHLNLLGKFNVSNALSAITLGLLLGYSLEVISEIMAKALPVQGRLERVNNKLDLNIYVDYAHKEDALRNVLECLKEFKSNKIITVFGCGGNRDRNKRPKMALVAQELSDEVIVTSDNPRDEDPKAIIKEIVAGFGEKQNYFIEEDRKKAIAFALERACKNDIILIAGKGHETYQIFAHKTIEFDDRLIAQELCSQRLNV